MIDSTRLRRLLLDLIDIYSPSGKEEEVVSFIEEHLQQIGLPFKRQEVEEGRYNLIIMPDNDPEIVFVGHVDTVVPAHIDDFRPEEDGDIIYGLGSADMKGGVAAMVEAFAAYFGKHGTLPSAALALVVGEEAAQDGAASLVDEHSFDWAIVGEPTYMDPCFSHYGYLEMELATAGRRVHASMAGMQSNAVKDILQVLLNYSNFMDTRFPEIVYNIRDLNSTRCGFAAPERCETSIDMHFSPCFSAGELMAEIEEHLSQYKEMAMELSFVTVRPGYDIPIKGNFPGILQQVYKQHNLSWKPKAFVSDSDAAILWREGIRPVILGPGRLEDAHTQDESVSFASVVQAAEVYLSILEELKDTVDG